MDSRTLSDAELVTQAMAGSQSGYTGLVDRHLGPLVGFLRYLGTPADLVDDIAQETFTRAFRSLNQYDSGRPFGSWLLTIGKHAFYDHCRASRRQAKPTDALPLPAESGPGLEENVIKRRSVEELLAGLPEDARLLVELRVFQDWSFAEIAALLETQEGNVRVRFHRLLRRLRESVEQEMVYEAR
jgi:RNA polymerase sigma factor (sigma-70 family)